MPGRSPNNQPWLARPASRIAGLVAGWLLPFGGVVVSSVFIFLGGQTLAEAETATPLAGPANRGSRIFALDRQMLPVLGWNFFVYLVALVTFKFCAVGTGRSRGAA